MKRVSALDVPCTAMGMSLAVPLGCLTRLTAIQACFLTSK